jgi:hypothetical protein
MTDFPRRAIAPGVHPDAPAVTLDGLAFTGLMVATPMGGGGVCDQAYMLGMVELRSEMQRRDMALHICALRHESQVHRGRNTCVARFMASDASHLLFIDSDIGFSADAVMRLLAHRKHLVGGSYRLKDAAARQYAFAALPKAERTPNGLVEVEGLPGGFMMLTRECVARMFGAYRDLRHDHLWRGSRPHEPWHDHMHQLFGNPIEGGVEWGEDLAFCRRWRAIGGRVWLDPHILLQHWGMTCFDGHPDEAFSPIEAA